jgi:RimJ/RimL family protein N-acetyltransferase
MDGQHLAGFEIVPYQARHLRSIALEPDQEALAKMLRRTDAANAVTQQGQCWTVLVADRPIACGGFEEPWEGRAIVWAVLSREAGSHMLAITRAVRRALAIHPAERIEAQAVASFRPAVRWLKLIGFEEECLLRKFHRGQDYWAFVLLKTTL